MNMMWFYIYWVSVGPKRYHVIKMGDSGEVSVLRGYIEERAPGEQIHRILLDHKLDDMMGYLVLLARLKECNQTENNSNSAYNVYVLSITELVK